MENDNRNTERITDLSYLGTICDGDQAFKREMIETFLNNTPSLINDMKLNLIEAEWKKIGDIAHKMKPSFTFMGIQTAKELILKIEHQGRHLENTSEIHQMVFRLESICNEAFVELKEELNSL